MRVLIHKATGKIIESQSGDGAGLEVLHANAKSAGFTKGEVEAKVIPDAEFADLLATQIEAETTYAQRRRNAYPSTGDMLDDLFKQGAFSPEMAAKIAAVKALFPKP